MAESRPSSAAADLGAPSNNNGLRPVARVPLIGELTYLLGQRRREVVRLRPVVAQVVEFPFAVERRHQFPIADAHGPVAFVFPGQSTLAPCAAAQRREKTLAGERGQRVALE